MKKGLFLIAFTAVAVLQSSLIMAQSARDLKPMFKEAGEPIICYFTPEDMHTIVPLRTELEYLKEGMAGRNARTESSVFEVNYFGFSTAQQEAFQYAVDIWAGLLTSDVPIRIDVALSSNMGEGTLASTGWGGLYSNFNNAQKINTWYVVPLAEKMAGEPLNDPEDPDIVINFNIERTFYTGLDQQTPAGQFDLVSIALHEIAHGLGFFTHTTVSELGIGEFGNFVGGNPTIYARLMENGDQENLYDTYESGTAALGNQLTGGNLYFNSFTFSAGQLPRLYAPREFNGGSSIAHLDESTYTSGTANSLMTPQIGQAESVHDPGISLKMLEDMGWISMDINHDALLDTEERENPYPIVAVAQGDNAVATDGVNLHYTLTNWDNVVVVPMAATANPDEYAAEIPASATDAIISYYISVEDDKGRVFTNPGEPLQFANQFVVAADTISPDLLHQPLSVVFENDPVATIRAVVEDNLGVNPLIMTYKVNGGATEEIEVPIAQLSKDGFYRAEHRLDWDLGLLGVQKGDVVEYKLRVTDASVNANEAIHPSEDIGFNRIQIDAINDPVDLYENNFNAATDDFIGAGFEIGSFSGFTSGIMHSDHPYRTTPGVSPEDTLILYQMLKTPIIISETASTIVFDEVVLIEPGEPGSQFGDDDFWDYVIVEGSSDLGVTWQPLIDGYDSRDNSEWLNHYNSNLVTFDFNGTQFPNSAAAGSQALFKPREIDIVEGSNFEPGEEILIRFKLYADQLAVGWGWAIDNLKIQVDDQKPSIAHIAADYLQVGATELSVVAKVTDNTVLDSVTFEIEVDGNPSIISVDEPADLYDLTINLDPVTESSSIRYRIIAVDSAVNPNTTFLPETGFFEIPIAVLGEAKSFYENDFNSETSDFYGANFNIKTESGFDNAAIHSLHPYSNSPQAASRMSYLLKYPINTNTDRAWMSFDEIALIDPFGDGVTVEVSNDNGANWYEVVARYGASKQGEWSGALAPLDPEGNSNGVATQALYKKTLIDLLSPAEINGGDQILVRFSLEVNDTRWAWGWAIDNLEIQGVTTSVGETELSKIELFPNPAENGRFRVAGTSVNGPVVVSILDMTGKAMLIDEIATSAGQFNKEYQLNWAKPGMYLVSVKTDAGSRTARLVLN